MLKKKSRILMILGTAAGTAAAVYGVNRGLRWWNSRPEQPMFEYHGGQRAGRYDTSAYMPQSPLPQSPSVAQTQPRYQPVDQPDRQAIPTTGTSPAPAAQFTSATIDSAAERSIHMDDLVGPLIEYAIAFNSVMTLLRSKQRDSEISETGQAFTPGNLSSMRTVLEQLREKLPDIDAASLGKNSLQQRTYRLATKLRDSLESLDYTESDLFRINGEVSAELCRLTTELEQSGKVTITGLDHVRQLYECGG